MPKVIPFRDAMLVKRRRVGTTLTDGKTKGGIVLPKNVEDRFTDLADVVEVPELTFSDKHILDNADDIIKGLTEKAVKGNYNALEALLKFNEFIKHKTIKEGDVIFMNKYSGIDFNATGEQETQTLVRISEVIGMVVSDEDTQGS